MSTGLFLVLPAGAGISPALSALDGRDAGGTPVPLEELVPQIDRVRRAVYLSLMTAIAEQLDRKLAGWKPETASEVERLVGDIIDWADADALDLMLPRHLEQEVLDILDAN
jgi:hypothetical protein